MLLLMNQHEQQQPPPPFLPSVSVSAPVSPSMGEQTQPQVPVQTQIHHQPQSQPSNQPQTQPQTPIQTQSESQPQIQSPSQLQPQPPQLQPQPQPQPQTLPDNPPQLQLNATTQAVDATTAAAAAPPPPQKPSSVSKIPVRPRKIRKVSTDVSSQASVAGDNATPTPPTNVTAANKKNNRGRKTTSTATSVSVTTTTVANDGKKIPVQPIRVIPRIVGKTLSCEGVVAAAIRHLRAADPQLARVIDVYPPPSFDTFHPPFLALTKSILYQQLAYKAGTSIYTRFIALCGGETNVNPDAVLSLSLHQLRQIGISARKASYLHDLAGKFSKGILSDSKIIDMDDKSLFSMLTMVNGIGSWSVHMFMIFSLHRPDVLPVNDLGVRKGVQLLHGLEQLPRPSQLIKLCEKWRPYRSIGAWYMWKFAEAKGVQPSAAAVAECASQPQPQPLPQPQQNQLLDPINGIASLGACTWEQ